MPTTSLYTAVLNDDQLMICTRESRKVRRVQGIVDPNADLIEECHSLAIKNGVGTLWIAPGSKWSEFLYDHPEYVLCWKHDGYDPRPQKLEYGKVSYPVSLSINSLTATAYHERRMVTLVFPQLDQRWGNDAGWSLADIEDSTTLLGTLCYLQERLGVDIKYSPGWTGIQSMKRTVKADWVRKSDLSMLPDRYGQGDILWKRPLNPRERAMKYLHVYDRNSMYLAAATGAECGEGSPEYHSAHSDTGVWGKKLAKCALWHVKLVQDQSAKDLPPLTDSKTDVWATTPMVETLIKAGCVVQYLEAWIWPTYHRTLCQWASEMWQSRYAFKNDVQRYSNRAASENAYNAIKIIATRAVGWLDLTKEREREEKGLWHRPDWKTQIVDLARARMFLKMLAIREKSGLSPVACYVDAVIYCSNHPQPELAVPTLMDRQNELGGFKHVRTIRIDQDLIKLFDADIAPAEVMTAIKQFPTVEVA